jgi:hypothetical protein
MCWKFLSAINISRWKCFIIWWRPFKGAVESLQSHCIHTMSHWSSGLPVCFPAWGTRVQSPRGYLCETAILLYVWIWTDVFRKTYSIYDTHTHVFIREKQHTLAVSIAKHNTTTTFISRLKNRHIVTFFLKTSLWRACNLTWFSPCLTGPVD